MPSDAGNGLTTFSLHATEEAASSTMEQLRQERAAYAGLAADDSAVSPETAARRFLAQALDSSAVPWLTAPVAAGTTSKFKAISTETIPLTGTQMVKFRQTLHDIPVYGSLVTVELDESNQLVSLDSSLGSPEGVEPVASVSPAQARAAAQAAPDGYTPVSMDAVPKLHFYFDARTTVWRLVYILEDVPVTLDRSGESAAEGSGPSSRRGSWTTWSTPTTARSWPCCHARRASRAARSRRPRTPSAWIARFSRPRTTTDS